MKPFLKWAGGKRWLVDRALFNTPRYSGRYFEPFLGGGAVFFHLQPPRAVLADLNSRLIETYVAVRDNWQSVWHTLVEHQSRHSPEHYYLQRAFEYDSQVERAAQFIYLNRACWNGLYRENLRGEFNVPIGTKSTIIFNNDDFASVAHSLRDAQIVCSDFEDIVDKAGEGDLIFIDPPYTTAHNLNGFAKYNQRIFTWNDQVRLRDAAVRALDRNCRIIITNAAHESIYQLYSDHFSILRVPRRSVISGKNTGRQPTEESIITNIEAADVVECL